MKQIIQFHVYKGDDYYITEGVDVPVVTQAKSLDELAKNIQEAVELQMEGEDLTDFRLNPTPSLMLNPELGSLVHA